MPERGTFRYAEIPATDAGSSSATDREFDRGRIGPPSWLRRYGAASFACQKLALVDDRGMASFSVVGRYASWAGKTYRLDNDVTIAQAAVARRPTSFGPLR